MNEKFKISELEKCFENKPFTNKELLRFYLNYESELNENTLRWRIYRLKEAGLITSIKRGTYIFENKKRYIPNISPYAKSIYNKIKKLFPYTSLSVWETRWLADHMVHQVSGNYIIVEVNKEAMNSIFSLLQENRKNVFLNPGEREIEMYLQPWSNNNIIVKNLIYDSPIQLYDKVYTPKLEKIIVDVFSDKALFSAYQGKELANIFESFFKNYTINLSTINRYAKTRNVKERLIDFIIKETNIDREKIII